MNIILDYSENYDINYLARLVNVTEFENHPNADSLKLAKVFGFKVIVGKECTPGFYVYFPVGSQISKDMLSWLNLFKESSRNRDRESRGTFENSGRVKMINLRGVFSEGYLIPKEEVYNWAFTLEPGYDKVDENRGSFDVLRLGSKEIQVCKKYLVKQMEPKKIQHRGKVPERLYNQIPKAQFRFHYETEQLKYNPHVIRPRTWIWITKKVDGTSGISSLIQVYRKPWELWKPKMYYQNVYASSSVIKSKEFNKQVGPGWYGVDIWGYANSHVKSHLESGMTLYYEIVGYLPDGRFIQKNCDFGCTKPEPGGVYKAGLHFRVLVYRVTITTQEGSVFELNPDQVEEWCKKTGLESVRLLYSGYAKDLYPDLDPNLHWSENFLERLKDDKNLGMETLDTECRNEVPQEGIVVRVGERAYKVKTNLHLEHKEKWESMGYVDPEDIT